MKTIVFSILIFLSSLPAGLAKDKPKLVVLTFAARTGSEEDVIVDATRQFALAVAGLGKYHVVWGKEGGDGAAAPGTGCEDPECAAAIGRKLEADQVIFGSVSQQPRGYILKTTLVDAGTASVIRSASTYSSGAAGRLLSQGLRENIQELLGERPSGRATARFVPPTEFPKVEFGIKAGLCVASLNGDDTSGWDSTTGFCGGGFLYWRYNEVFGIQPELLYVMKGAQYEEDYAGGNLKVTLDMDYLEIPILAKAMIPTSIPLRPDFFAGPYLGFKFNGKQKAEYEGSSTEEDIDNMKSMDFGLVLGAGADYDIGAGRITFDIRYSFGLSSAFSGGDVKNSVFAFMLGYVF